MRRLWGTVLIAVLLTAASVRGQEQDTFLRLPLRVSSSSGRTIVVDRGTRDHVEPGDRVFLSPRSGGTYRGTVSEVEERTAVVRLDDRELTPEPGTRGEVLVPRARIQPKEPEPGRQVEPPPDEPRERPERGEWPERKDGWEEGMPLLAKVRPVRPDERPVRLTGRIWALGDLTQVPDTGVDDRWGNSTFRFGTAVDIDNPFGQGGAFRFDGELNHWTRPDDQDDTDVLVRDFSYRYGGTRFAPNRWQIGRFLQSGMPEFGILDGLEWSRRLESGHRVGASVGYMPELDNELRTGEDLQFAGYFHWTADDLERMTFDVGYQKSFHDGDADRDLFVLKSRYLPNDDWDLIGTAWVDYYYGRDDVKGNGFDLTQAFFAATRRWEDGSGYELAWRHYTFPETLRYEFEPLDPFQLANDVSDRVSLGGWTGPPGTGRTHGEISGWIDETDEGGAAELGFGFNDVFFDRDEFDITAFGSIGSHTSVLGMRTSLGRYTESGRWDLFYEFSNQHLHGRDDSGDDMFQHRFRGAHTFFLGARWSASLHAEGLIYDEDLAWSVGFHMQKTF